MANIHGIKDIKSSNNQNYQRKYKPEQSNNQGGFNFFGDQNQQSAGSLNTLQQYGDIATNNNNQFLNIQNIKFAQEKKVMFISGRRKLKHPNDQFYWDMIKQTCCPVLKCCSFTTLALIVDLAMFIISLSLQGGFNRNGSLLAVTPQKLIDLGGNQATRLRAGQVYRLLGAFILHADFMHWLGNSVTTLIFVSRVQYTYGFIKTGLIYIISGIGGNIFSALCNPGDPLGSLVKIGASTCLYGILGIFIGYVIINWYGLDLIGQYLKCQLVCLTMFVLIFVIVFTSASSNIDYVGHIGGFLTGLWLSSVHQTLRDQKCERIVRILFLCLFVVQFVITFVLFYTLNSIIPYSYP